MDNIWGEVTNFNKKDLLVVSSLTFKDLISKFSSEILKIMEYPSIKMTLFGKGS